MPTPTWKPNYAELPRPVLTKRDFCLRYAAGEFGNHAPTWDSLDAMEEDFDNSFPLLNDPNQLWHIRNRVAGGPTWYDIDGSDLPDKWAEVGGESFYISAMAPTDRTLIQGEIRQSTESLYLYYSKIPKPMRQSLLEGGQSLSGVVAIATLYHYMDPSSYDWIRELLTLYPEHVIEFSVYSVNWGTIPGRNTVVWEVRRY